MSAKDDQDSLYWRTARELAEAYETPRLKLNGKATHITARDDTPLIHIALNRLQRTIRRLLP
jgi:hypothetical protein